MSKLACTALSALFLAGSTFAVQPPAQPGTAPKPAPSHVPTPPPQPVARPAPRPHVARTAAVWSDPEFEKIGAQLVGTWKTTAAVGQLGSAADSSDVVMSIAHVSNAELKDVMYVETSRADSLATPYRHAMFQLYKAKGKVRLRTYEFTGADFDAGAFTGLWNAPELFPQVKRTNLIATLDLELAPNKAGNGYSGRTPYPYPTGVGGAVEMTSEITLTGDAITSADRGYDADGKIVWGSGENAKYTFTRFNPPVKVAKKSGDFLILEYKKPGDGRAVENNDKVAAHFTGWLTNGVKWDGSRVRGQPASFTAGASPMAGLNEALTGATRGTVMRMYLPAPLAFGDKGYTRNFPPIPPNSDVILELEVMGVEPPPAAPLTPAGLPPIPSPAGVPQGAPAHK